MSSLSAQADQARRRITAQRVGAAGRSRRADAGTVTEMARSLLRDAREAGSAEVRCRQTAGVRAERIVRRAPVAAPARLTARPFAARRA
jgi:hypothetical protein